jgi:hypothetical protein
LHVDFGAVGDADVVLPLLAGGSLFDGVGFGVEPDGFGVGEPCPPVDGAVVGCGADDDVPCGAALAWALVGVEPGCFAGFVGEAFFATAVGAAGLAGGIAPVEVIVGRAPLVMPTGKPLTGTPRR